MNIIYEVVSLKFNFYNKCSTLIIFSTETRLYSIISKNLKQSQH